MQLATRINNALSHLITFKTQRVAVALCSGLTCITMALTQWPAPGHVSADIVGDVMQTEFGSKVVAVVQVAYRGGLWWSLPVDLSAEIIKNHANNQNTTFCWQWDTMGRGSWCTPEGAKTDISRYEVNLSQQTQRNIDNNRKRTARVVWMTEADAREPEWTGEVEKKRQRAK